MRPARPDDAHRVAEIVSSSADWYEPLVHEDDLGEHDVDSQWARENFRRREFFVAEFEDDVVGTVTFQVAGTHAYLGYVYLHADMTGRGLGKDLLRFAEAESRDRGFDGMVLIAHPDADWAVRAYERYGFTRIATTKEAVLAWNDGWLKPFYEEGFHLFEFRHEETA